MKKKFKKRGPLAMVAASWGLGFEQAGFKPFYEVGNAAVVEINGPLMQKAAFWDGYDLILERFKCALASPKTSVILKINSPGGDVAGLFECAREMRRLATESGKRVCSYADGLAASAAFALACAAPGGIFVPQTGQVGSVGCIHVVADQVGMDRSMGLNFAVLSSGARKSDGNPHVEISDEARASFQSQIDTLADLFFDWVSETRGLPVDAIRALEGGVFIGAKSVGVGLADSVLTFETLALGEQPEGDAMPKAQASAENEEKKEMSYEDMIAALKSRAEGDSDEAKKCRKMLSAAEEGDDNEKKEEASSESDEEKKDDAPPPKKEEAKAMGPAAAAATINVVGEVMRLSAEVTELRTRDERRTLMLSRPDLVAQARVKAMLETMPIDVVRQICSAFEKPKAPKIAAVTEATPTRGEGQTEKGASRLPPSEALAMKQRMGLVKAEGQIRREGNKAYFGAMSPEAARKWMEENKGSSGTAAPKGGA